MDQEEFDRIKAQEKEHLKALQKLKAAKKVADRQLRVKKALDNIQDRTVFDTHDEMLDRLQRDNIETEAKLELAMDSAEQSIKQENDLVKSEAELQKIRAALLVEKMKAEMFGLTAEKTTSENDSASELSENNPPAKTVGRQVPKSTGESDVAENQLNATTKSIGRPETSLNPAANEKDSSAKDSSAKDSQSENATTSSPSKSIGRKRL